MPGFYLFFTNSRAIIVSPFFLQYPKGAPKPVNRDIFQVEMIGFETSSKGIINTLRVMYERYRRLPSKLIGEASDVFDVPDCETLLNGKPEEMLKKLQALLSELDPQFTEAKKGEYKKLLNEEKIKVEMNVRLLYKNDGN